MATNIPIYQQNPLSMEDLRTIHKALIPIAHKFTLFGHAIGIQMYVLKGIDMKSCEVNEKLLHTLDYRLNQCPQLTWKDIVNALKSPTVDEKGLARKIEEEYLPYHAQSPSKSPPTKIPRIASTAIYRQHSLPQTPSIISRSSTSTSLESFESSLSSHHQLSSSLSVGSEAVMKFITFVKNQYRSQDVERNVKFSLTPTKVFINLALIDCKITRNDEYRAITVAMVQDGNVDVVHEKKGEIKMNDVAKDVDDRRLILVVGAPGVGKSTFAWEFCRQWLQGKAAQQYHLVFLLRLRDERIKTAKKLMDILHHPSNDVSMEVFDELVYTNNYNVLIILEGFDELPDDIRNDQCSLFNELIAGVLLPLATILITSRPWATKDIRRKHENRLFQHIEVLGFSKRQINKYIEKTVPDDKVKDLKRYLGRHPRIKSGMYIPLNCSIVVRVYLDSQDGKLTLPTTQTQLYLSIIEIVIGRHMQSKPELRNSVKTLLPPLNVILPNEVHENFSHLCKIAYQGIVESGDNTKLIFSDSDIPPNLDNLGFMDSLTDLYLTQETKSSHNFLHLTFQEFFAAAHISSMCPKKQLEFYKDNNGKRGGRLEVVLRFLAGLTRLGCFTNESALLVAEPSKFIPFSTSLTRPRFAFGIDVIIWMFEAQSEEKISIILGGDKVEFKGVKSEMSPMDYFSLGYVISHSLCQLVLSLMGKMLLSEEKIKMLAEGATGPCMTGKIVEFGNEVLENLTERKIESIFQKWGKLICLEVESPVIFKGAANTRCPIKFLDVSDQNFSISQTLLCDFLSSTTSLIRVAFRAELQYESITKALTENKYSALKSLVFEGVEVTNKAAKYLIEFVKTTNSLYQFSFVDCRVSPQELVQLYQTVSQNELIKECEFCNCKSDEVITCNEDVKCFSQLLSWRVMEDKLVKTLNGIVSTEDESVADILKQKKTINLSNRRLILQKVAIELFFQALHHNQTLEELRMSNNKASLNNPAMVALSLALKHNSTLLHLDLSQNILMDEGIRGLGEALTYNSSLKELILSDCEIGANIVCLAKALHENCTLKTLDVSLNSSIGSREAKSLAEALSHNSTLERVNLSYCQISDDGAIVLSQALERNSYLKVLNLTDNRIGELGIASLAAALEKNTTLLHLDLMHNTIGINAAKHLAKAIRRNFTLKELILSDCYLGEGVRELSLALANNKSLRVLSLQNNDINEEIVASLAHALTKNTSLLDLDLSSNIIGEVGLKSLAAGIACNSSLQKLCLSHCDINDEGALLDALQKNQCLHELYLNGNNIERRAPVNPALTQVTLIY